MTARGVYPLLWTAAFVTAAVGTYWIVTSTLGHGSDDPTRARIRSLIDECDQLYRTLDEQRRA